jgi:hypothetical protein
MDARSQLLTTAYHHSINEPSAEIAYQHFRSLVAQPTDYASFCDAVADLLRERLILEPVRLPEGALQCHWHLQLTPKGVEAARSLGTKALIGRAKPGQEE